MKSKDQIFSEYSELTNMSCSKLKKWKQNSCSTKASLSRDPIKNNLRLQCRKKSEWTEADYDFAKKAIGFLKRNAKQKAGKPIVLNSGKVCGSKRDIASKNWAKDRSN